MDSKSGGKRPSRSRPRPTAKRAASTADWREETLSGLRGTIVRADPAAVEEVKWRRPSNPDGAPVWSHDGILCVGNVLKSAVRLTFPRGAQIPDPKHLFNTRLDSRTVRAIDVHEGESVDERALEAIVREAERLNARKAKAGSR